MWDEINPLRWEKPRDVPACDARLSYLPRAPPERTRTMATRPGQIKHELGTKTSAGASGPCADYSSPRTCESSLHGLAPP